MSARELFGPVNPFELGTRESLTWATFHQARQVYEARASAASELDRTLVRLRHQLARLPGDPASRRELAEAEGKAAQVEAAHERAWTELEAARADLLAVVRGQRAGAEPVEEPAEEPAPAETPAPRRPHPEDWPWRKSIYEL